MERPEIIEQHTSRGGNASCCPQLASLVALWGMLAMGLGVMAWPGEALAWTGQPLAYVTSSNGISVIDTGDNKVVDTIPVLLKQPSYEQTMTIRTSKMAKKRLSKPSFEKVFAKCQVPNIFTRISYAQRRQSGSNR